MPTACLLVPRLALTCELVQRPVLEGQAVALTDESGLRVAEATDEAEQRGVRPGQTLREAVAYCPALAVLEPRPARVRHAAERLVEALEAVSPLVEEAAPGVVYADLRGLEGLYPEPGQLERAVLDGAPFELHHRLGIAGTRFTAYAAARCAPAGEALHVPSGEEAAFLAPKPVEWLPLPEPSAEAERAWLRLLGIETLGEFAALPRHAVEAQFGAHGGHAWLAARGEDATPLRPHPFRERVREQAQAQPPLVSRESVLRTAEQLLGRALRQPPFSGSDGRRRFVRVLRLRATTEDERIWERTQVLKEPTGDRRRLWTTIRPALEGADYPGPVAEFSLELGGLTAESGRQTGLFAEHTRRREYLDEMVRHLKVRYGQSPLMRVVEVEPWSRIPERRRALLDYNP